MAVVVHKPLPGLGSEVQSLSSRYGILAAARAGNATESYAAVVTVPATGSWAAVTDWPTLTMLTDSSGGAFVFAGCTLVTPASGTVTDASFGLAVDSYPATDGPVAQWSYQAGNTAGDLYPLTIMAWWPDSGGSGAPISVGTHNFTPALLVDGTGSLDVQNMFLVVCPL